MKLRPIYLALLPLLALGGCGSSSDSDPVTPPIVEPEPTPEPITTINGVASQGGAVQGYLSTASALAPAARTYAAVAAAAEVAVADGRFELDLSALTLPTVVKISGTNSGEDVELYSLVLDDQHPNLNLSPLSRLLISRMTGADAADVYADVASYRDDLTAAKLAEAQAELRTVLAPLLNAAGLVEDVDLLTNATNPDYQGLDAVLGLLDVRFEAEQAVLTYRASDSTDGAITLPYSSSWGAETLPNRSYAIDIQVMAKADAMLEQMILLNKESDKDSFMAMVHPEASWFGVQHDAIFKAFSNGAPNESSEMDRYRDLVITKFDKDKQAYRVSFTERFEAGKFASAGRQVAWFAYDPADAKLKFLGEADPLPTSANAFYKLYYFEEGYGWPNWETGAQTESFLWALEVDAYVDGAVCDQLAPSDPWEWDYEKNPAFIQTLTKVSEVFDFDHILVVGPGLEALHPQRLDRIFKDPESNGCHLIISDANGNNNGGISPMMDGIYFDVSEAVDNARYELQFKDGDGNTKWTKTIGLPKGPENNITMKAKYLAKHEVISGAPNAFTYQWTRPGYFVNESDLWVYFTDHEGAGTRVAIADAENAVSLDDNDAIERVFHSAFDAYGRVLQNSYVKGNNDSHLINK
ncbi:hypothetical protein [uncultured Ferrimonas sp.]|uniref:hypothetical protein n=1 Tax=uncultured Ferrimonas sp. TaxID=432640 RepID=UPI0026122260|nr:hypothetical protein [uncultured Ferrimonas sp.]